ncbi:CvpA family protein [Desulforhopalus vacuolatus]|uniref:CvpA family protein n=1 Tax=Desulforhopalus vacuolatus TaxID=40414 RepID=UPI001965F084|nr:CvpA family protein [Desulforhopalus vacuolatus]MBM9519349.1 CvpA family protein [Desulforhopalus vacuolatus]
MNNLHELLGPLTMYDMVILGILGLLVARGLWVGAVKQVTALLALYLGFFVASQYHEELFPILKDVSENPKVIFLVACVILFIVTYIVVVLLGKLLSLVLSMTLTSWFDHLLGGVVGFFKGVMVVVLLHLILGTFLAPQNDMLRKCATCDVLNDASDYTRNFIRDSDVRKSLEQKTPAINMERVKKYIDTTLKRDE